MRVARETRDYGTFRRHYGWALGQLFDVRHHSKVIILEDDMQVAPDFFEYFEATAPLLCPGPPRGV
jgi:alpha-1,3-mannosyl-glycoprotein beta-1,2-N-acetylglucosaminyltransferase